MFRLFRSKDKLSQSLKDGDKIYYPSSSGMALIGQVTGVTQKDVIVSINGKEHYLEKANVDNHAVKLTERQAAVYITQRLEDPDNDIVFLRVRYQETAIDRLYNLYCKALGRPDHILIPKGGSFD